MDEMRNGSRGRLSTGHSPMVKEDIFCLERCRDAQGVCQIEEWVPALPNQKVFSDWRDPICRFGFDCASCQCQDCESTAARATGISAHFGNPLRKANVKPPRAGARRRTPDSKTSAITMVATAGNQSFLGYRIDKGVPGMIQCALHSVHNRPGVIHVTEFCRVVVSPQVTRATSRAT